MSEIIRLATTQDVLPAVRYPDLPMCPCCEGEHLRLPFALWADGMYHAICPATGLEVPYTIKMIRMGTPDVMNDKEYLDQQAASCEEYYRAMGLDGR